MNWAAWHCWLRADVAEWGRATALNNAKLQLSEWALAGAAASLLHINAVGLGGPTHGAQTAQARC